MPFLAVGAALLAGVLAAFGWLARPLRPDPRRRAELSEAVSAVDRELAANLELMSMFDQTRHPVVLENSQFARHHSTLERSAGGTAEAVAALYARIPETESAMERRGPAQSLRDEDRRLIEGWEGDAREAQRALRRSVDARALVGWAAVTARLHGRAAPR
ncbi:MAG TPA: hypothetical protein VGR87_08730 [Candidatus Limnocylindria bacterium]|jgi:hypothetical protein|nr:hypothetical protein [Candidatus Limnocylindria bacterium]